MDNKQGSLYKFGGGGKMVRKRQVNWGLRERNIYSLKCGKRSKTLIKYLPVWLIQGITKWFLFSLSSITLAILKEGIVLPM